MPFGQQIRERDRMTVDTPTSSQQQQQQEEMDRKKPRIVAKKLKLKGMEKKTKSPHNKGKKEETTREQLLDERVKSKSDRYCMST